MQTNSPQNLHKDHRKRVRQEYLAHGFDEKTPPHKVLELLLFYSIPRKDTNELAHEVLNRFGGSLENVLDAEESELRSIDGISDSTIVLFQLVKHLIRTYRSKKVLNTKQAHSFDELHEFLYAKFLGLTKESFKVLTLNNRGEIISVDTLNDGDVSSVGVSTREIVEVVIKHNATGVMVAHNHPKGTAIPSSDDITLTSNINKALSHINVFFLDHLIVTENDFVSMRWSKEYQHLFNKTAEH